jgi:hypothetical protein
MPLNLDGDRGMGEIGFGLGRRAHSGYQQGFEIGGLRR